MYIDDIPKTEAETYIRLLKELHPDCPVSIAGEDSNLYLLGFADDIPCRLEVNLTFDEAEMLYDEVMQMEVDAYNEDDRIIYSPYNKLTDEEKRRKQIVDEYQYRCNHFACLEPFLFHLMDYLD